jgi:hypothetical protein
MGNYRLQRFPERCENCEFSGKRKPLDVSCFFDKTMERKVHINGICDKYKKRAK